VSSRTAVARQLASYAAASVAMSLPWPLLLVLAWDRYGDGPYGPLIVGLTGAARMLPYVLLSWVVGSLGDRIRRERLLAATLVLRVLFLTALALALASGQLALAVVAAALAVAAGTPAYPCLVASMPRLAGADRRRATEALVTIEVGAWVVGPAVGGLLLFPATRDAIPWLAVVLTVVALLLARGVALPGPVIDRSTSDAVRGMFCTVRRTPVVASALAAAGLLNLVESATAVTLLPLTREAWHQGDAGFGVATAWLGFGALAAPLLWWMRGSERSRRTWGLVVLGFAVVYAALSPAPLSVLPVLGLAGVMSVVVECAITETLQYNVPDAHRAGVLGLGDAVMVSCAMVGTFLAPLLAAALGPRLALVLLGATCVVAALLGLARSRRRAAVEETAPQTEDAEAPHPAWL
jgi:MFS family permease